MLTAEHKLNNFSNTGIAFASAKHSKQILYAARFSSLLQVKLFKV